MNQNDDHIYLNKLVDQVMKRRSSQIQKMLNGVGQKPESAKIANMLQSNKDKQKLQPTKNSVSIQEYYQLVIALDLQKRQEAVKKLFIFQLFFYYKTKYMIGQDLHPPHQQLSFKKGMTLDQYLSQMQTLRPGQQIYDKVEQDLYKTSQKNEQSLSKKIITYEIRESQEDEYDESHEERGLDVDNFKLSVQLGYKQQRLSNKNILLDFPGVKTKDSMSNSRGFRVRKQSNSPFNHHKKDSAVYSPNKNFAMTLFNNEWKNQKQPQARGNNPSTSLYGKFLKGIKQPQEHRQKGNSKQKYFQKKNTAQMQHIIKYEKDIQQKYNKISLPQSLDMRIEGVTDRLHQRKSLAVKVHK